MQEIINLDTLADNGTVADKKEEFTTVRHGRKKTMKSMIGKSVETTNIQAVEPRSWYFISRLHPGTTTDDINTFLNQKAIKTSSCSKLPIASQEIAAFRIAVNNQDIGKIMSPEFWPENIIVRPYQQNRIKNFQKKAPVILKR